MVYGSHFRVHSVLKVDAKGREYPNGVSKGSR